MDNDMMINTYDEMTDEFVNTYIDSQRDDFYGQWSVYTGDDTINYEKRYDLKNILREGYIF